jgi:hypothetical protein
MFGSRLKQDLHAHTNPQDGASTGNPAIDQPITVDRAQPGHTRCECSNTRHHQSVAFKDAYRIGRDLDLGSHTFQRALC